MGILAKLVHIVTGSLEKVTLFQTKMSNWLGQLGFLFVFVLLPIDACFGQSSPSAESRQGSVGDKVVFMDITIGGRPSGTIKLQLYNTVVPKTADNFYQLCRGTCTGDCTSPGGSLVGSPFHRVIPGFMIQGGDFTRGDGRGGRSIYGEKFADENFIKKHTKPGLLSMANSGPDTNGSQFFITVAATPWLNNKHVVFGEVIDEESMGVVNNIVAQNRNEQTNRPNEDVLISACFDPNLEN